MAKKTTDQNEELVIKALRRSRITLNIIGETGLYLNEMSAKAKRDLTIGGQKKTAAEKKTTMKHDPVAEYRASQYATPEGPTLIAFPAAAIKQAMATAALVTSGIKKTEVQRLVFLPQERLPIYGRQYLRCDVVRSADMARTPDVRTRAFLPKWATTVTVDVISDQMSPVSVQNLLMNAGVVCGIGDFRQEKGRGSYGTFRVVASEEDQAEFESIIADGGRDAQQDAYDNPIAFDSMTRDLMAEVNREYMRRNAA